MAREQLVQFSSNHGEMKLRCIWSKCWIQMLLLLCRVGRWCWRAIGIIFVYPHFRLVSPNGASGKGLNKCVLQFRRTHKVSFCQDTSSDEFPHLIFLWTFSSKCVSNVANIQNWNWWQNCTCNEHSISLNKVVFFLFFLCPRGPLIKPSIPVQCPPVHPSRPATIFPEFTDEQLHCRQASGIPQTIYFLKAVDVSYPNSDENTNTKTKDRDK